MEEESNNQWQFCEEWKNRLLYQSITERMGCLTSTS